MAINRKPIFDAVRQMLGRGFSPAEVVQLDRAIDAAEGIARDPLTARVALELVGHEAIVLEWYKDSVGVGTWGIGVTDRSGHDVDRYRDNPQTIRKCLEVYVWLLREKYIPAVARAFAGFALTEEQFAAALSFHYNTGAIERADWVKHWRGGNLDAARVAFLNYRKPPEIIPRRTKERDLFFDGKWSNDGKALVLPVRKPSYQPDFRRGQRVDITTELEELLG